MEVHNNAFCIVLQIKIHISEAFNIWYWKRVKIGLNYRMLDGTGAVSFSTMNHSAEWHSEEYYIDRHLIEQWWFIAFYLWQSITPGAILLIVIQQKVTASVNVFYCQKLSIKAETVVSILLTFTSMTVMDKLILAGWDLGRVSRSARCCVCVCVCNMHLPSSTY